MSWLPLQTQVIYGEGQRYQVLEHRLGDTQIVWYQVKDTLRQEIVAVESKARAIEQCKELNNLP